MRELTELLLFRETGEHRLLDDFHLAVRDSWEGAHAAAGRLLRGLAAMAGETGFYGNLWHDYLTSILVSDENSYSLSAERRGAPDGTVRGFALHDMAVFREWFDADLTELARKTGVPELSAGVLRGQDLLTACTYGDLRAFPRACSGGGSGENAERAGDFLQPDRRRHDRSA